MYYFSPKKPVLLMIRRPCKGINKYIHVKSSIKQKNYRSKKHKYRKPNAYSDPVPTNTIL